MTEKDLQSYRSLCREMKQIESKIKQLEHSKYSIKSPTYSDMPKGGFGDKDKIGTLLANIEEQTELYWDKYKELLEVQSKIEKAIEELDPVEREVIRYKYFDNKRFEEISCIIKYSYITVRRIHKKAMEKIIDFK